MTYLGFIESLKEQAESSFADFQKRLIFTKYEILGVRTPTMRAMAKRYFPYLKEIWAFPNEYYEVVFIKLTIVCCSWIIGRYVIALRQNAYENTRRIFFKK